MQSENDIHEASTTTAHRLPLFVSGLGLEYIYCLLISPVPMLKASFFSEPLYKTSKMHEVPETCGGRQAYCGEY